MSESDNDGEHLNEPLYDPNAYQEQPLSQRSERARVTFYDVPEDPSLDLDSEYNDVSHQWMNMPGSTDDDLTSETGEQRPNGDTKGQNWLPNGSRAPASNVTFPAIRPTSTSESSRSSSQPSVRIGKNSNAPKGNMPEDMKADVKVNPKAAIPLGYMPTRIYNGPAPIVKPAKVTKQSYAQMFSDSPKSRASAQAKSNSSAKAAENSGGVIRGNSDLLADLFSDHGSRSGSTVLPRLSTSESSNQSVNHHVRKCFFFSSFVIIFRCM